MDVKHRYDVMATGLDYMQLEMKDLLYGIVIVRMNGGGIMIHSRGGGGTRKEEVRLRTALVDFVKEQLSEDRFAVRQIDLNSETN